MKRKGLIIATIALAAMVMIAGVALARGHGMGQDGPPAVWKNPEVIEDLGLTESQIDQLRSAELEFNKAKVLLKAKISATRMDLEGLLDQDDPDVKKARNLTSDLGGLHEQMLNLHVDHKLKLKEILEPDQLRKLEALRHGFGPGPGKKGERGHQMREHGKRGK